MTLTSMTGFARAAGSHAPWRWTWELKSVNSRGLDLRLRVPPGFDVVEAEARKKLAGMLARGAVYANLTAQRDTAAPQVRINEPALLALQQLVARLPASENLRPASMDGLLNIRGIVEVAETADDEVAIAAVAAAMLASLDHAASELTAMRNREGAALTSVLAEKLNSIAKLTARAEDCPGRQAPAIRARLEKSIAELVGASPALDPVRLHQEALLLAGKADVREELDRLVAHVAAARELIAGAGAVGRRLDFLAQELGREANTLCSKSNDKDLTAIGMELRVLVEQFREQVQNIE